MVPEKGWQCQLAWFSHLNHQGEDGYIEKQWNFMVLPRFVGHD